MPSSKKLTAKHCAGGLNVGTGVFNIRPEENVESRNMEYTIDGSATASLGYGDPGWSWGENASKIDGLHKVYLYPDLLFAAVNGKIKYVNATTAPQSSGSVYEADTGLSLTAGNPVFMRDYLGTLYFCNGVDNFGRISIGQLQNAEGAGSTTWELNDFEGYRFTNGADKVYCEGDEVDYTAVSTDDLTTVSNGLAHDAGDYVTQYNSITAPSNTSGKCKTIAFWKDTMWIAGMPDFPGMVSYGKTIGEIGHLTSGNIHNFTDNNVYIIGDGGAITALQATEDRLYVFLKDKVHFIGIVYSSTGARVFDKSKLFTGVYGCPNAFCVTEMEDVVIFFTGKRLIRIGYDPNGQQLIPDEAFDKEILPFLQDADEDQSNARITYNPSTKELRLKYIVGGVAKVIKYHKQMDKYSGLSDEDANCYVVHRRNTYFGDVGDDTVWKIGQSIDSEGDNTQHRYQTGRMDGGNKNWKLFKRGRVSGKKNIGSTLYLQTKIEDKNFAAARTITDTVVDQSATATPLGEAVIGGDTIGDGGETINLFPYTYRFLLGKRGKDYSFAISSDESGAVWTVDNFDVEWEEFEAEPRTNY